MSAQLHDHQLPVEGCWRCDLKSRLVMMRHELDLEVMSDPQGRVCAGCGTEADDAAQGWRHTDAAWCPKCRWLA